MEAEVKAFEPRELWRRYKEGGDGSARERLVVAYSPLVKFLAGRTGARLPSHVDQADLISYGMFGLIEAMERFEPRRSRTCPSARPWSSRSTTSRTSRSGRSARFWTQLHSKAVLRLRSKLKTTG
jgi:hypothetical protein